MKRQCRKDVYIVQSVRFLGIFKIKNLKVTKKDWKIGGQQLTKTRFCIRQVDAKIIFLEISVHAISFFFSLSLCLSMIPFLFFYLSPIISFSFTQTSYFFFYISHILFILFSYILFLSVSLTHFISFSLYTYLSHTHTLIYFFLVLFLSV